MKDNIGKTSHENLFSSRKIENYISNFIIYLTHAKKMNKINNQINCFLWL